MIDNIWHSLNYNISQNYTIILSKKQCHTQYNISHNKK